MGTWSFWTRWTTSLKYVGLPTYAFNFNLFLLVMNLMFLCIQLHMVLIVINQWIDRRIGATDLRLKLQKKNTQNATQGVRGSLSGGFRDLREKLSGTMYSQMMETEAPKSKPVSEVSKPARKSVVAEAPASEKKAIASSVSKKKTQKARMLIYCFYEMNSCSALRNVLRIAFQIWWRCLCCDDYES